MKQSSSEPAGQVCLPDETNPKRKTARKRCINAWLSGPTRRVEVIIDHLIKSPLRTRVIGAVSMKEIWTYQSLGHPGAHNALSHTLHPMMHTILPHVTSVYSSIWLNHEYIPWKIRRLRWCPLRWPWRRSPSERTISEFDRITVTGVRNTLLQMFLYW